MTHFVSSFAIASPTLLFHIFNLVHLIFTLFFLTVWHMVQHARRDRLPQLCSPMHDPHPSNAEMMESRNRMNACGGPTGLEASRAPYSKSHARRLKRKEREELVGGRLGTLQAALPSMAPIPPCQRWREVRGKTRRPRGRCHHHDHSHRHLVRKTRRQVQRTHRRGCGRATARKRDRVKSGRGKAHHSQSRNGDGPCTTLVYFFHLSIAQPVTKLILFFFVKKNPFTAQESRAFSPTFDSFEPRVCGQSI